MTPDAIWNTFQNMKYKEFMLEVLVERYQRMDRRVNIFLALASSSSIAAWAVWSTFPMVWGIIIAASQVVTAIKPYFPYYKIAKELNGRCLSLSLLNNEYQRFYVRTRKGKLPSEVIEQSFFDYNLSYAKLLNFPEDILFETTTELEQRAKGRVVSFFKTNFNV